MGPDQLRDVVGGLLLELDDPAYARAVNDLIDRAARSGSGWTPPAPSDEGVASVLKFAEAARRVGHADPFSMDDYLRQGSNVFLAKGYEAARAIFRALLPAIAGGEIDLGQHEMVDEVLGIDAATCALRTSCPCT
jgi:hypothetical protein